MTDSSKLTDLPTSYARGMKEQPKYKWWKPIVAGLLAAVFTMVFIVVVLIVWAIVAFATGGANLDAYMSSSTDPSALFDFAGDDPYGLAITFLPIICIIPAVGLANKIMGLGGLRCLSSVEGKLRWNRIWALLPWALLVAFGFLAIELVISYITEGPSAFDGAQFPIAAIVVILVLCPLQCAAEEYMCRGFLLQAFSSWIPAIVIPLVLQAIIFAAMHSYNALGLVCVLVTGLITGYLAIKTGGLEAGICMHTANNLMSFLVSAVFVSQQAETDVSAISCCIDLCLNAAFLVVLYQACKRKGFLLR